MKLKYLIRLDDACPEMDAKKWGAVEQVLDKQHIDPLVGIVPKCEDKNIQIDLPDKDFWKKARKWQDKGYAIALHGYNHVYATNDAGINPIWNRSEFAGLPIEKQRTKIKEGLAIFKSNGINAEYFFAPSHTFDGNTLKAIKLESDIHIISDTMAFEPYREDGFVYIPCQAGHFANITLPGIWTFCFHPNNMTYEEIEAFEDFITNNRERFFSSWKELDLTDVGRKSISSHVLSWLYFTYRRVRGIH